MLSFLYITDAEIDLNAVIVFPAKEHGMTEVMPCVLLGAFMRVAVM